MSTALCYYKQAAIVKPKLSTKEIQDEHMAHIAEITKYLAPVYGKALSIEQEEWLKFRMVRPFPEPYRQRAPMVFSSKWQETDSDD